MESRGGGGGGKKRAAVSTSSPSDRPLFAAAHGMEIR